MDGRGSEGSIARCGRAIRRIGVEMEMVILWKSTSEMELFGVGESPAEHASQSAIGGSEMIGRDLETEGGERSIEGGINSYI